MTSTNGRQGERGYPNSSALQTAGKIVRGLDSIHPALASAVVNTLFRMPFSKSPTPAERAALDGADRMDLPFRSRSLAAYAWGTGPTVLLIHGWASNAGAMRHLVEPLVKKGFRVVAFDAPAHGSSPGRTSDAVEYGSAIRGAIQFFAPVHGIFAHSFGATSTLLMLSESDDLPIAAVVVNNPPLELEMLLRIFAASLALPEHLVHRIYDHVKKRFGKPVEYFSLRERIRSVRIPGLLIADRDDRLATFEDSELIASRWARGQLFTTEGLGHQGALRDGEVIEEIASYFKERPHSRTVA